MKVCMGSAPLSLILVFLPFFLLFCPLLPVQALKITSYSNPRPFVPCPSTAGCRLAREGGEVSGPRRELERSFVVGGGQGAAPRAPASPGAPRSLPPGCGVPWGDLGWRPRGCLDPSVGKGNGKAGRGLNPAPLGSDGKAWAQPCPAKNGGGRHNPIRMGSLVPPQAMWGSPAPREAAAGGSLWPEGGRGAPGRALPAGWAPPPAGSWGWAGARLGSVKSEARAVPGHVPALFIPSAYYFVQLFIPGCLFLTVAVFI